MLPLPLKVVLGLIALPLGALLVLRVGGSAWWWKHELLLWRKSTVKRLEDKHAQEPDNPLWAVKLAKLYQRRMYRSPGNNPEDKQAQETGYPPWEVRLAILCQRFMYPGAGDNRLEQASKAFAWYERAYRLTSAERKLSMLANLAKMAFDAQAYDKAALYATELLHSLPHQPDYATGHIIHDGNLVLGRLALRQGDLTKAKDYLLKSGQALGGPGLSTGGPSMILAKELLEQGESETVLQYLALCARFWKMDFGRLKRWTRQVQQGRAPRFGRQLYL